MIDWDHKTTNEKKTCREKSHPKKTTNKERYPLFFVVGMLTLGPKPTAYNPNRDASTQNLSGRSIVDIQEAGRDTLFTTITTMANSLRMIDWDHKRTNEKNLPKKSHPKKNNKHRTQCFFCGWGHAYAWAKAQCL